MGMVVSSCTVEDIKTIFIPKNAEAEITVLVLDIVNGKDVTTEAKLSTNSRFTQTFLQDFQDVFHSDATGTFDKEGGFGEFLRGEP